MDTNKVKQDAIEQADSYWAWFKKNAGRAILSMILGAFIVIPVVLWILKALF